MNILFITGHKYLPQMYGGLQTSTDEICRSLKAKGHNVSVLAGLWPGDDLFTRKARAIMYANSLLGKQKFYKGIGLGYPVWYVWEPWNEVGYVASKVKPDIIVVLAIQPVRMALAAKRTGIPVTMQLMDVDFNQHGGDFKELGKVVCMANSHFTAQKYHEHYGIDSHVIPPFISAEKYKTVTSRENITFINPHKTKGVDIALALARNCPEIPFAFVEAWPLDAEHKAALLDTIKTLPNVTLQPAQSNMKQVYAKTRILLAPSIWAEAFGRVASEAHLSGIPVIASNRGGLPEAVGPGGITLDPDSPIEHWIEAVRKLWYDQTYYNDLSAKALEYSKRQELDPQWQIETMEAIFENMLARSKGHD